MSSMKSLRELVRATRRLRRAHREALQVSPQAAEVAWHEWRRAEEALVLLAEGVRTTLPVPSRVVGEGGAVHVVLDVPLDVGRTLCRAAGQALCGASGSGVAGERARCHECFWQLERVQRHAGRLSSEGEQVSRA